MEDQIIHEHLNMFPLNACNVNAGGEKKKLGLMLGGILSHADVGALGLI